MKRREQVGIRQLKAQASHLVDRVAEGRTTYTITRRGQAVGILAPPDYVPPSPALSGEQAWDRVFALAEQLQSRRGAKRRSALRELNRMRR
jgi:prevent-host-death family protein